MSHFRIFEHSIKISKRNRVSHFRIFMHIDARDMSPSHTFCLILEYTPYHLISKREKNSVLSQEIGGENGIFSKKHRRGDFGIFLNSTAEVEKTVRFYQVEKMGSPG